MSDSVPTDPRNKRRLDEPYLMPHSYDGIQEYDQRLPNWWLFTFYGAIVFAFFYWLAAYQFGLFSDDGENVSVEIASIKLQEYYKTSGPQSSSLDDELWEWSRQSQHVAQGKETYELICAACHGKDLTAKIGEVPLPGLPLHDAEWKYGGSPEQILQIVAHGSPDVSKGMVAWEPQVGKTKCRDVVAYILSHHEKPAPGAAPPPPAAEAPAAETPAPTPAPEAPPPASAPDGQ